MVKLVSGRPNIANEVLDKKGKFRHVWFLFMIQMWEKLGGAEDRVNDATPTGMISGFGGATAPTGWLICDGSAVSRAGFQDLFDIIGVVYGVGDGSTTFNLPDGQGRTLVGAGIGSSLTSRSRGDKFGEETHILTTAELTQHAHTVTDTGHTHAVTDPNHSHGITDPGHAHANSTGNFVNDAAGTEYDNTNGDKGTTNANTATATTGVTVDSAATGLAVDSATTGIAIDDTGSGDAFNVLGPSWVANFMIKT